jgi:hypothetical protein
LNVTLALDPPKAQPDDRDADRRTISRAIAALETLVCERLSAPRRA